MAKKVQIARPTKIELARLKRRLALAERVQKIVKDRLAILVMEFIQIVKECSTLKVRLIEEHTRARHALSLTLGRHGRPALEHELLVPRKDLALYAASRNVAGVRIPLLEAEFSERYPEGQRPLSTSALVEETGVRAEQMLVTLIALAEKERSLELLGREISKVKRINNALEHSIVPGLNETIKYLTMKFEERDREEAARLKRVKLLIEKREAHAY